MKFIESGPDIPDELLLALDEGRVVFFCGAGVSRADANLPDFFELAKRVRETLGDLDDSLAANTLAQFRKTSLDSIDRVFSLLEEDFSKCDIERAVAKELKPKNDVNRWAHEVLLDLATTRDGVTKLVTTNFDRLFDDCGRGLKTWQPQNLPNPAKQEDMNGIVYLHGRATEDYDGVEGDWFVLSKADFGSAYLYEGWATRFFKDVIDRYSIVFVGYSTGDPLVQYLLDGLGKSNGRLDKVYAFQPGTPDDGISCWGKGVSPIIYDCKDDHVALWDTLKEWAECVKDPEGWQKKIIAMARRDPESLAPFEREQVAHLVSTKKGARKFLESDPPAPATWLCVFDPSIRYSNPRQDEKKHCVDPFDFYGLASDVVPAPIPPDNPSVKREIPPAAWDVFALNRRDLLELRDEHVTPLRGDTSLYAGRLPDRISNLGEWISKVSNQNAAVWWGVRQLGLHKDIQWRILWKLKRSDAECAPHILKSWEFLFEHWRIGRNKSRYNCYRFKNDIKDIGWSKKIIQKYEEISRPRLTVRKNFYGNAVPPQINEKTCLKDLILIEMKYNIESWTIPISDEWLAEVVSALKRNLDIGIQLETECDHYWLTDIPPIIRSDDSDICESAPSGRLSDAVPFYAKRFERLLTLDVGKAQKEAETWSTDDNIVFARLRIWASRFETLVPNEDFDDFFGRISREAFWERQHQRDLLLTLKERWAKLPVSATRRLEERILEGPEQRENETKQDFVRHRASRIADRLHWLYSKGCNLNVNYNNEIKRLRKTAPDWIPENAEDADRSREIRGGVVRTDTEYSALLGVPLSQVLTKAREVTGRNCYELVDDDPFAGLSTHHPVRALSALRLEAKGGEYPEWAWERFLHSEKRKQDNDRFKNFIAELLISANDEALKKIIYPVSKWFFSVTDDLAEECVPNFERLAACLLDFLNDNPDAGKSGMVRGNQNPDWATEALNSPAGNIVRALYHDPRYKSLVEKQGILAEWSTLVEKSLALPEYNGRYALVFLCANLNWFYRIDPEWTEKNLLSILRTDNIKTFEIWWTGYCLGMQEIPGYEMFELLKPHLLKSITGDIFKIWRNRHELAWLLLVKWGYPELKTGIKQISNKEFRKILFNKGHKFRFRVLWQLERWSEGKGENAEFWKSLRKQFLCHVWPKQKTIKTPQNSVQLIEFAFSDEECFGDVSDAILPLISEIKNGIHIRLYPIGKDKWSIIDAHPKRVLEILDRVLPKKANNWPYEIGAILDRIIVADPSLRKNTKWIELSRRRDSR